MNKREFLTASGMATVAAAAGVMRTNSVNAAEPNLKNSQSYQNKTAFITGGARGIGLACAKMFASNGANVVIYDIASKDIQGIDYPVATESDLELAKQEVEKLGVKCLTFKGDVRSRLTLTNAMKKTVKDFGSLDFLIVNAGVTQIGKLEEFSDEEIAAVLDINLSGAIKTTQVALPILKKQKSGRIVYISSILGRRGNKDWPIYAASKWGLIGFAKSTAHLMAKENVTCNTICPGLVNTKLVNNEFILKKWMPQSPSWTAVEKLIQGFNPIPIGAYKPEDIAGAVKIFCDPSTAQVTGEVFDIAMGASSEATA